MTRRRTPYLTLPDLIAGVESWEGRYDAIDVFADDVEEMHGPEPLKGLRLVDEKPLRYELAHAGRTYHVVLFEDAGVLRLEKPRAEVLTRIGRASLAGAAGAAIDAIVAKSEEQKGSAAKLGLLLGLFAGAFAEGIAASRPQRIYAMRFDPYKREWVFYEGGLRNWMREKLLPT